MNELPPAGWYPNPDGTKGPLRYWDGTIWTSSLAMAPAIPHGLSGWLKSFVHPARWTAIGAGGLGGIGAVVGLVVGLQVNAPTAPFAVVELGLPATIVGGGIGFIVGAILAAGRHVKRNDH